jgi:hypothetical protein
MSRTQLAALSNCKTLVGIFAKIRQGFLTVKEKIAGFFSFNFNQPALAFAGA